MKCFTQTIAVLQLTCSRQSQHREEAARTQQTLHFGCQGPSAHPHQLYIPGASTEGQRARVTLRNCIQISHCVSEQLSALIKSGIEQREAGIYWLSWNSGALKEVRCGFKQVQSFHSNGSGKLVGSKPRSCLLLPLTVGPLSPPGGR